MRYIPRMNLTDILLEVVRQEVRRRIELCMPIPDRRYVVDFSHAKLTELKESPMPTQTMNIEVSGDAPFGYLLEGIAFVNKAGNPADPDPNSVVVTTSDASVCGASFLGGGRLWVQPLDSAAVGATFTITVSANETGTDDDGVISGTIVADRVGAVDLAGATITELTAPPV